MRKIKILQVSPSSTAPGSFDVVDDFTSIFQGSYWRSTDGSTQPLYAEDIKPSYVVIAATTFDVVGNKKFNGRYTVFSRKKETDLESSVFQAGRTTIRVNEIIPDFAEGDAQYVNQGFITNISTYLIDAGDEQIIVPPGVVLTDRPVQINGQNSAAWGEGFTQNIVNITRNFAGETPPENPFVGQIYFNTASKEFLGWHGTVWVSLSKAS